MTLYIEENFKNTIFYSYPDDGTCDMYEDKENYIIRYSYMSPLIVPMFYKNNTDPFYCRENYRILFYVSNNKDCDYRLKEFNDILNISKIKVSIFGIKITIGRYIRGEYIKSNKYINFIADNIISLYPISKIYMYVYIDKIKFLKYKMLKPNL